MTDPFYMLILMNNLGKDYIVWDKAARIDFKRPGRGTVSADFTISAEQLAAIRAEADARDKYVFDLPVVVRDAEGKTVAEVTKTLYVRRKSAGSPEK
jgi:hypothetical protein